jgi:hypothetical protein
MPELVGISGLSSLQELQFCLPTLHGVHLAGALTQSCQRFGLRQLPRRMMSTSVQVHGRSAEVGVVDWVVFMVRLSHAPSRCDISTFVVVVAIPATLFPIKLFVDAVIHELSPLEYPSVRGADTSGGPSNCPSFRFASLGTISRCYPPNFSVKPDALCLLCFFDVNV